MKAKEKIEARRLRKEEGESIKVIARNLNVSPGTVSIWVRDIKLTENQQFRLMERTSLNPKMLNGSKVRYEKALKKRKEYQQQGAKLFKKYKQEWLFTSGCNLYWAEGAKNKNTVSLSNSDPYLLKIWKSFLQTYFGVQESDITIYIQCYLGNGVTKGQVEKHWISMLNLSKSCLRKTTIIIKHPMSKGYKKNKHPYGMCGIRVHDTKIVQNIFGAIKELAGITEDKWLN